MRLPVGVALLALAVSGCAEMSGTAAVYASGPFSYDAFADRSAAVRHAQATVKAAEDGKIGAAITWASPKGATGSVVPLADSYTDAGGRTCRRLKQEVTVRSATHAREAEACRLKDGTWVVADRPA